MNEIQTTGLATNTYFGAIEIELWKMGDSNFCVLAMITNGDCPIHTPENVSLVLAGVRFWRSK